MQEIGDLYEKYEFPPYLIFNMDETMVDASGGKLKIITRAKSPRPFTETEGKLDHITYALCISAAGAYLKPLCILPLKTLPHLEEEVLQFFSITGQENGFISNELWHKWIEEVFIPYVEEIRRIKGCPNQTALLIADSHVTRGHQPTIDLLEQHNIHLKILPAHSSTILQPLDLSCNKEFKRALRLVFPPLSNEDKPTKRNRLLYSSVFALQSAFLGYQIQAGFKRSGLFPYSPEAPLDSNLVRNPLLERSFEPPKKKKRGVPIAGKLLTTLPKQPLGLPSSSLPIEPLIATPPSIPLAPIVPIKLLLNV